MRTCVVRVVIVLLFTGLFTIAQDTTTTIASSAASGSSPVPRLIRFSGIAKDAAGKPMAGVVGITFSLYKDQQGGAPLWMETQNVQPDSSGHYSVLLGSTKSTGLPAELFASSEAQWLGMQPEGESEQARVLMVSVPYALKALDAETVGGKPASAFSLATPSAASESRANTGTTNKPTSNNILPAVGGSGGAGFIALWKNSTTLGKSAMFQSGTNIKIGTTSPTQKFQVSFGDMLAGGVNNFKANGDVAHVYAGDKSHSMTATFNRGLSLDTYLVPNSVFVQDRTGWVGIGTTTPLSTLDVNGLANVRGGLTGTTGSFSGTLTGSVVNTSTSFDIGGVPFAFGTHSGGNAFLGFAGNDTMTGDLNTALGSAALAANTTGNLNTASGTYALQNNTTG